MRNSILPSRLADGPAVFRLGEPSTDPRTQRTSVPATAFVLAPPRDLSTGNREVFRRSMPAWRDVACAAPEPIPRGPALDRDLRLGP